mmetsp:Transcript_14474/g.33495  ORF Transcript_14474/g.33495 Transcript_14474/m.33495 type:complete len:884 (+) Transcript_14474:194-2845(+)
MKHVIQLFSFSAATALLLQCGAVASAGVKCNSTDYCSERFGNSSMCLLVLEDGEVDGQEVNETDATTGVCSNPFVGGCLRTMLTKEEFNQVFPPKPDGSHETPRRECNSNDKPFVESKNYCGKSDLDYTEIIIAPGDWESSVILSWIMQIFLSEVLQVPVSLHTTANANVLSKGGDSDLIDFYDPLSGYAEDTDAYKLYGLQKANQLNGNCASANNKHSGPSNDTCIHIIPEYWETNGAIKKRQDRILTSSNGLLGQTGWYVPSFVLENHPDLSAKKRDVFAELFKTPITWGDYCQSLSPTNCSKDDVAMRPPETDEERTSFFAEDDDEKVLFKGYFNLSEENNCTLNPGTCKGHILDYPCDWSSFTDQQIHHNKIPLDALRKYKYSETLQIMKASNYTRSPIITVWWHPDFRVEQYNLTQFSRTILPLPTQQCGEHRAFQDLTSDERCAYNESQRIGDEQGKCAYYPELLQTLYSEELKNLIYKKQDELKSPAFEALQNFEIRNIHLSSIIKDWLENRTIDHYGIDLRQSACKWVARMVKEPDSSKNLKRFIPNGYPRFVSQAKKGKESWIFFSCLIFAIIVMLLIFGVFVVIIKYKKAKVIQHAQPHFLKFFLIGRFLLSVSGVLFCTTPKKKIICGARDWVYSLGLTLAMVPLLIKIAAINHILNQSDMMRRVSITKKHLFGAIGIVTLGVIAYLTLWTLVDGSIVKKVATFGPSENANQNDNSSDWNYKVVEIHFICTNESESSAWRYIFYLWEFFLTFGAALLAFQSREVRDDFNESREIGNMAYVNFVFCALRFMLYTITLPTQGLWATADAFSGFLIVTDSLLSTLVYFGPKLWTMKRKDEKPRRNIHVYGVGSDSFPMEGNTLHFSTATCPDTER